MKTIIKEGTNDNVIISLHGTGGTYDQLFDISAYLDEDATFVGLEGRVLEGMMRRYFKRFPDGSYDYASLRAETDYLNKTIHELIDHNGLSDKNVIVIGYSNGANIIQNLLKEYSNKFSLIGLLHPSTMRPDVKFEFQNGANVFISSGKDDPFISMPQLKQMEDQFKDTEMNVTTYHHLGGHEISNTELEALKELYEVVIL